ncbi:MAG: glucose/arabinose dehydrogenase [Candidatus Binatia bacterium]|jgi:glucose/arabinose dehydrogenase
MPTPLLHSVSVRSVPRHGFATATAIAVVITMGLLPQSTLAAPSLERVVAGLQTPVFVTTPPATAERLFIVEKDPFEIRIFDTGSATLLTTPFLAISGGAGGGESGLLGLAFDPDYASNGYFYVNFTAIDGPQLQTIVRRYTVSGDPDVADASSALDVLRIDQPQSNHNGGWIGFGPDDYLYVAVGDGGSANDSGSGHVEPTGNSQDTTDNLLGKMLRIDTAGDDFPGDPNRNYAVPADNPFVGVAGDDEIWAYGLRNPWRASFDRANGDLYIGDVGQGEWEEIDVQAATSPGGTNYGWRLREGTQATPGGVGGSKPIGAIDPIYEYSHGAGSTQGFSVTGGYVYRGPVPALVGNYFFSDFVSGRLWSIRFDGSAETSHDGSNFSEFVDWTDTLLPDLGSVGNISSFGEDGDGNLYIVDFDGEIFRVVDSAVDVAGDHYMFYRTRKDPAAERFAKFGPVILNDAQFTVPGATNFDILVPKALGLPADKNAEGVLDANTHLRAYKLTRSAGSAKFPKISDIAVANQCGSVHLKITKPREVLIPAARGDAGPVATPDDALHEVDHYLCYGAKVQRKLTDGTALPRLARNTQVDVVDDFETKRFDLIKPRTLCMPVTKSGSPVFLSGEKRACQTLSTEPAWTTRKRLCFAGKPS